MILLRVRGRWVGLLGLAGAGEAGRFFTGATHLETAGVNDGSSRVLQLFRTHQVRGVPERCLHGIVIPG